MVRRFRLIDAEFRRLAPTYPNTVVINRDQREFHAVTACAKSSSSRACRRSPRSRTG